MLSSMTGFGSAMKETPFGRISVEVRSVNNRFLELNMRLGSAFYHLDPAIRGIARKYLQRGKVDLTVKFDPSEQMIPSVELNKPLLQKLMAELSSISEGAAISPTSLLSIPGVVMSDSASEKNEELDQLLSDCVVDALKKLVTSRASEGEMLQRAFEDHRDRMMVSLKKVKECQGEVVIKYRDRLHENIERLMEQHKSSLDPGRLEQEVAMFADKADLTEEIIRLGGHLEALDAHLNSTKKISGKALEFLSQEILRETNTIASKCRDLEIAKEVIELKQELESLRENLANVE